MTVFVFSFLDLCGNEQHLYMVIELKLLLNDIENISYIWIF